MRLLTSVRPALALLLVLSAWSTACADPPEAAPLPLRLPVGLELARLAPAQRALVRVTLAIDGGVLAETNAVLHDDLTLSGDFALNNVNDGETHTATLRAYGRLSADTAEVLLGSATDDVEVKAEGRVFVDFGGRSFTTCAGNTEGRCAKDFDENKNGITNIDDLIAGRDPAEQPSSVRLSPADTLQFSSGTRVGSFARQVIVVENTSSDDVRVDAIRVAGGQGIGVSRFVVDDDSVPAPRSALDAAALDDDGDGVSDFRIGPGAEAFIAVTFAPQNAFLTTASVQISAVNEATLVPVGVATRVIANADGALRPRDADYVEANAGLVDLAGTTVSTIAFPAAALFSGTEITGPSSDENGIAFTGETVTVDSHVLGADAAFVVDVPAQNRFSASLAGLASDVDLAVVDVSDDVAHVVGTSRQAGTSDESVEAKNTTDSTRRFVVLLGRVEGLDAIAAAENDADNADNNADNNAEQALTADERAPIRLSCQIVRGPAFDDARPLSVVRGALEGGEPLEIFGTGFFVPDDENAGPHVAVSVAGVPVVGVPVVSAVDDSGLQRIRVVLPPGPFAFSDVPAVVTVQNPSSPDGENGDGQAVSLADGFRYDLPAPRLDALVPDVVSTNNPATVTASGAFFFDTHGSAAVEVSGAVVEATVVDASTLSFTPPPQVAASLANVTVRTRRSDGALGAPSNARGLRYATPAFAAPTLTSVAPNHAASPGGGVVVVSGDNFRADTRVFFGNVAAGVQAQTATSLEVVVPASAVLGAVDIVVQNSDGQFARLAGGFTYEREAPAITSVFPSRSVQTGGASLVVAGVGFGVDSAVFFDDGAGARVAATTTTFISSRTLLVTSPAFPHDGAIALRVENGDGQSAQAPFTYFANGAPPPRIVSVTPTAGVAGTEIQIAIADAVAPHVVIDGVDVDVAGVSVDAGLTVLRIFAPAHANGLATVTVINDDEQTASTVFTYADAGAPSIASVSPAVLHANSIGDELVVVGAHLDQLGIPRARLLTTTGARAASVLFAGESAVHLRVDEALDAGVVRLELTGRGVTLTSTPLRAESPAIARVEVRGQNVLVVGAFLAADRLSGVNVNGVDCIGVVGDERLFTCRTSSAITGDTADVRLDYDGNVVDDDNNVLDVIDVSGEGEGEGEGEAGCGDGIVDVGEQCDDRSAVCSPTCKEEGEIDAVSAARFAPTGIPLAGTIAVGDVDFFAINGPASIDGVILERNADGIPQLSCSQAPTLKLTTKENLPAEGLFLREAPVGTCSAFHVELGSDVGSGEFVLQLSAQGAFRYQVLLTSTASVGCNNNKIVESGEQCDDVSAACTDCIEVGEPDSLGNVTRVLFPGKTDGTLALADEDFYVVSGPASATMRIQERDGDGRALSGCSATVSAQMFKRDGSAQLQPDQFSFFTDRTGCTTANVNLPTGEFLLRLNNNAVAGSSFRYEIEYVVGGGGSCGDGFVDVATGETCDPPGSPGCDSFCNEFEEPNDLFGQEKPLQGTGVERTLTTGDVDRFLIPPLDRIYELRRADGLPCDQTADGLGDIVVDAFDSGGANVASGSLGEGTLCSSIAVSSTAVTLAVGMRTPVPTLRYTLTEVVPLAPSMAVTTTDDIDLAGDGLCSLREAVEAARTSAAVVDCAGSGPGVTTVQLLPARHTLDLPLNIPLDVSGNVVTLRGAGSQVTGADIQLDGSSVVVDGIDFVDSVVAFSGTGTLSLNNVNFSNITGVAVDLSGDLTISGGNFFANTANPLVVANSAIITGTIVGSNSGTIELTGPGNSVVQGARFNNNTGVSAALTLSGSATADITDTLFTSNVSSVSGTVAVGFGTTANIERSHFEGNTSAGAAALHVLGTARVRNSSFVANRSDGNAGAVDVGASGTLRFSNVSMVYNTGATRTGGLFAEDGANVAVKNSILIHNAIASAVDGFGADCNSAGDAVTFVGDNLVGEDASCVAKNAPVRSTDPGLILGENLTSSATVAPVPSPGLVTAAELKNADCLDIDGAALGADQRLTARVGVCTLGAVELPTLPENIIEVTDSLATGSGCTLQSALSAAQLNAPTGGCPGGRADAIDVVTFGAVFAAHVPAFVPDTSVVGFEGGPLVVDGARGRAGLPNVPIVSASAAAAPLFVVQRQIAFRAVDLNTNGAIFVGHLGHLRLDDVAVLGEITGAVIDAHGPLSAHTSAFVNHTATAIFAAESQAQLLLDRSTVSSANTALRVDNSANAVVRHSTVVGRGSFGLQFVGGFLDADASLLVGGGFACGGVDGVSRGQNASAPDACFAAAPNDVVFDASVLDVDVNQNGGRTPTLALLTDQTLVGDPAGPLGTLATCTGPDQRGALYTSDCAPGAFAFDSFPICGDGFVDPRAPSLGVTTPVLDTPGVAITALAAWRSESKLLVLRASGGVLASFDGANTDFALDVDAEGLTDAVFVSAGDIDADGDDDVLLGRNNGTFVVFQNDAGALAAIASGSFGRTIDDMVLADVNGDTFADAVGANASETVVAINTQSLGFFAGSAIGGFGGATRLRQVSADNFDLSTDVIACRATTTGLLVSNDGTQTGPLSRVLAAMDSSAGTGCDVIATQNGRFAIAATPNSNAFSFVQLDPAGLPLGSATTISVVGMQPIDLVATPAGVFLTDGVNARVLSPDFAALSTVQNLGVALARPTVVSFDGGSSVAIAFIADGDRVGLTNIVFDNFGEECDVNNPFSAAPCDATCHFVP